MTLDVFREATKRWKATRHPRWAAVAEVALASMPERPLVGAGKKKADIAAWFDLEKENDPLDLDRLVAAMRETSASDATERLMALAKRDDPRLITRLINLLETPPWRANVYKPFVEAAIDVFQTAKDARAREAMAELAPRYKAIIETSVGDWTGTKLAKAAEAMKGVEPRALTPADEARLAELEKKSGVKPFVAKKGGSRSDAELLSLVYEAPDEDGPRLVFADALMERGDARGEFIQLQVRRAAGSGSREALARERALASDRKRFIAWGLPLSNGGVCHFHRGFVEQLELKPNLAKKVVGERAWATVREARGFEALSAKVALELLRSPQLATVRRVERLGQAVLDHLEVADRPWTSLGTSGVPSKAFLQKLSALERLAVLCFEAPEFTPDLFAGLPLRELVLATAPALPKSILEGLPRLSSLELQLHHEAGKDLSAALVAPVASTLKSLEVNAFGALGEGLLEPLTLETLSVSSHRLTRKDLEALLATQSTLRELRLHYFGDWVTAPVVGELLAKHGLSRVDVETDFGEWSLSNDGTLELRDGTNGFEHLFEGGLEGVKRVRVVERLFENDPLRFFSLTDDEAAFALLREAMKQRGLTVETP